MSDHLTAELEEFLHELHRQSRMEHMFPFPLIATAIGGEDTAIVVFRTDADAPLVGRFYAFASFAAMFDPRTPADLADAAIVGDMVAPTGPGRIRDYPWEKRLTGLEERVGWLEEPEQSITAVRLVVPGEDAPQR